MSEIVSLCPTSDPHRALVAYHRSPIRNRQSSPFRLSLLQVVRPTQSLTTTTNPLSRWFQWCTPISDPPADRCRPPTSLAPNAPGRSVLQINTEALVVW